MFHLLISFVIKKTALCVGLVTCLATFAGADAGAAPQPKNLPVQILGAESGSIAVQWEDLQANRIVLSLFINSPESKEWKVETSITALNLPNETIPIILDHSSVQLNRFQAQRLTLAIDPIKHYKLQPGIYSAALVIQDADHSSQLLPVIKQVQVTIPSIQPALAKATLVAIRYVPFSTNWSGSVLLPLRFSSSATQLPSIEPKESVIRKDSSGISTISWSQVPGADGRSWNAELKVSSLPSAGRYDGDVNFGSPQDKNSTVSVTVIGKDFVLWPSLVITFGILLAWLVNRYTKVVRSVWMLRKQEADLGVAFQQSQDEFEKIATSTPFQGYSIAADLHDQRHELLKIVSTIEAKWSPDLSTDSDYQQAIQNLHALQASIAEWSQFAAILEKLHDSLEQARSEIAPSKLMPAIDARPFLFLVVANLLEGAPITLAELNLRMQAAQQKLSLLTVWRNGNQLAQAATSRFQQLAGQRLTEAQTNLRAQAEQHLVAVWQHLWGGDLDTIISISAANGDLDSANTELAQIEAEIQGRPFEGRPLGLAIIGGTVQQQLLGDVVIPSAVANLSASDTRRAVLLLRAMYLGDSASTIFAFILALLTGLSTKYFGQAFGTVEDYVVLFLWGAGTKATLDIITSVIGKFSGAADRS